jgi:RNA polymerase sigma factor (sigma-70 family)
MPTPQAASLPPELSRLLSAREGSEQEEAWGKFVTAHSGLLLHTCRTVVRDRDAAMDGYAHVIEALREDCYRRLRAYTPQVSTRFTTWLVVVTRRLLLDDVRHRYGRPRSDDDVRREAHIARRRLEDLVATEIDPEQIPTPASNSPDVGVRRQELTQALRQALDELGPSDRLLLALRFEDGRPVREIAATMNLPTVFHVYRRVGIALAELKRALARRGVDEPEP